jgi:nucleotide-binding universal stress UspA family protein
VKKILCATDFSSCAESALAEALRLARALGAELVLLHVAADAPLFREGLAGSKEVRRVFEAQREWAKATLEERAADCRGAGVPTLALVVSGVPFEQILTTAETEAVDLIVLGTHGRGGLGRWLLGSVADRVVRSARCPVLTVREPAPEGGA